VFSVTSSVSAIPNGGPYDKSEPLSYRYCPINLDFSPWMNASFPYCSGQREPIQAPLPSDDDHNSRSHRSVCIGRLRQMCEVRNVTSWAGRKMKCAAAGTATWRAYFRNQITMDISHATMKRG
jgi:hypothetical protein